MIVLRSIQLFATKIFINKIHATQAIEKLFWIVMELVG